ncbi:hypothetical protein AVEN_46310-1 [Araneus ventricosus]|uniref:Uncharacterized protein n=1 Tax=Araneus ventricosus TaxID=182803 RepID=A0A4Y2K9C0_ARAVE|nr:hypothetical protein AVEN_46310-1 [Araneus ventricosus]
MKLLPLGSRGTQLWSAQASLLFRKAAICGGTSVTYFLNASWNNWKCLSEVASDYYNFASERLIVIHQISQKRVNTTKTVFCEHSNFINNDEHCLTQFICFRRYWSH